jgi:NAD(P)-dependent dehydrogenase (short-subunit alcohol dehydrogenase family)
VKTEDLHYTYGRRYTPWESYGQSKLANLLFAKGLADRLKDSEDPQVSKLTAVAVHPGVIKTNLWK